MGKIRSVRPVWYKSKDLERIKDVYQGTTVLSCLLARSLNDTVWTVESIHFRSGVMMNICDKF
jgi:hypothetical protein